MRVRSALLKILTLVKIGHGFGPGRGTVLVPIDKLP